MAIGALAAVLKKYVTKEAAKSMADSSSNLKDGLKEAAPLVVTLLGLEDGLNLVAAPLQEVQANITGGTIDSFQRLANSVGRILNSETGKQTIDGIIWLINGINNAAAIFLDYTNTLDGKRYEYADLINQTPELPEGTTVPENPYVQPSDGTVIIDPITGPPSDPIENLFDQDSFGGL